MNKHYTTQQVIDMASRLYDTGTFSRLDIRIYLETVLDLRQAEFDIDRVYDLVVG